MAVSITEWSYLWLKIIAKAWSDPDFTRRLVEGDARSVIEEEPGLGNGPGGKVGKGDLPLPFWIKLVVRKGPEGTNLPPTMVEVELPTVLRVDGQGGGNLTIALADLAEKWGALESGSEHADKRRAHDWMTKLRQVAEAMAAQNDKAALSEPFKELVAALHAHSTSLGGVPGGQENPLVGFEQQVLWFIVWPQAVARAWSDSCFAASLYADARLALHDEFGYDLPGGILLQVTPSAPAPYHPGWRGTYPRVTLTVQIPTPPEDELDGPVALSVYAGSGRSNPFTLCVVAPC
jgi:ribosomally synthesized peptide (two-chain TOMM family)